MGVDSSDYGSERRLFIVKLIQLNNGSITKQEKLLRSQIFNILIFLDFDKNDWLIIVKIEKK